MTIGTDDAIHKFGTQDALEDGATAAVTDTSFSASADATTWTNDDDAPMAFVVLTMQYASGTLNGSAHVVLHRRMLNIVGTLDEAIPDASHHVPVGVFLIDPAMSTATDTPSGEVIALPNSKSSQEYEFYIENQTGVTISAGWDLDITPITVGPHV